ncbi:MAG: hypothetical protein JXA18_00905 [Chitinispirillaceae bacterium]|nr:hypothetical protein [Chitinispirillaceae bacterium]
MLFGKDIPFPEHPVCKRCITRPCKRLFSGRIYPGKMIAVHHSEFLLWPCHTPNLQPQQEASGEAVALTDEIEVITGKLDIANPRWEPVEEAAGGGDPELPLVGDTIRLLADIKNYPEGAPVSFDIYDVTESTPLRIATVKGSNKSGKASAEWVVEDPQKRGEGLKLSFEAGARSKYTQRADIPWRKLGHCIEIELVDDEGNPIEKAEYIITDSAGTEKKGVLDKGHIKLEGLAPGPCEVVFPEYDEGAWTSAAPAASAPGPSPAEEQKTDDHWIEIELADEEGAPVKKADYIVTDSAGTEKKGSLDNGYIKLEGLAPGSCEVFFPEYDEGALAKEGGK